MDFFEQQDQTRRSTRVLVVFFVLAALCIVVAVDLVVAMAVRSLSGEAALLAWPNREWMLAHPKGRCPPCFRGLDMEPSSGILRASGYADHSAVH